MTIGKIKWLLANYGLFREGLYPPHRESSPPLNLDIPKHNISQGDKIWYNSL